MPFLRLVCCAALLTALLTGCASKGDGSTTDLEADGTDVLTSDLGDSGDTADVEDTETPEDVLDDGPMDVDNPDVTDASDSADMETADVPPEPCRTRVSYGNTWIAPPGHDAHYDDVSGVVTWVGACTFDGQSSFATLSNGWQPYFAGQSSCLMALDVTGDCDPAPAESCRTRITYGDSWLRAPNHPNDYDEANGVITWSGECEAVGGGQSRAVLSNGWMPHFEGSNGCDLSFRYTQCGGLYANPVLPRSCPDPGVAWVGDQYAMVCTSGNAQAAFPIRTSPDLVSWRDAGHVFPSGTRPDWATGDFWAPELHQVGDQWVVYYSARAASDGSLALGAATSESPLGPFTDLGRPLLHDPTPGVIDAHFFEAPDGKRYLTWKRDGNAVGQPTPIFIQSLAADGVTLTGTPTEILRNTLGWEGALVEGQWMVHRNNTYYLFYSANGYASPNYAVGVARSGSPTGPFEKHGPPILSTNGTFAGPGHGSVLQRPGGEWVHVYHSWLTGSVGSAPGRQVLLDRIRWMDGWPTMLTSPSPRSQPPPL